MALSVVQLGGLEQVLIPLPLFRLIVITGPTGSGKSDLAVKVAQRLGCCIISADSRQVYRDIPIGTAAPTAEQLAAVEHHMVGILGLEEYYSAARYEADVLTLIEHLKERGDNCAVLCGGSMMYVDAVTRGLDDLPTITDSVRADVLTLYEQGGLPALRAELNHTDPDYLAEADPQNHRRLIHAIEIIRQSGHRFSAQRSRSVKNRPFTVEKYAIDMSREELFSRINRRVEAMMAAGLLDEARRVYPLRHLNSLNTVGYKELFDYFDGKCTLEQAVTDIARNTRVYAKKQLTWLKRDSSVKWLDSAEPFKAMNC